MKKTLLSLLLSVAIVGVVSTASAQCDSMRYYSKIFSQVDTTTAVYTDPAITSQLIDIYQPTGDAATMRKAILFIHGGSFYGGTRRDGFITYMCREFAKRGYVTASIDYRLVPITSITSLGDSNTAYPFVIKAIGDSKAAVRYLKRYAASLRIDTNWIVIGGESAGAIIGNHVAYVKTVAEATPLLVTSFNSIGGIEGNSGNPGYTTRVKAVLNYAGSLLFTGFLDAGDHEPIYSAHGDADNTVPYLCGQVLGGSSDITTCGSGAMKPVLDGLGITNALHTFQGADHVPWEGNAADKDTVERETGSFLYQMVCQEATVGIQDLADASSINLYPNPASKVVTIKTTSAMQSVTIIDQLGRIAAVHTVSGTESKIDLSNLSAGVYMARIAMKSNTTAVKSLIIE